MDQSYREKKLKHANTSKKIAKKITLFFKIFSDVDCLRKNIFLDMSSGYKIRDAEQTYFVTFTVVYWIDALSEDNTGIL